MHLPCLTKRRVLKISVSCSVLLSTARSKPSQGLRRNSPEPEKSQFPARSLITRKSTARNSTARRNSSHVGGTCSHRILRTNLLAKLVYPVLEEMSMCFIVHELRDFTEMTYSQFEREFFRVISTFGLLSSEPLGFGLQRVGPRVASGSWATAVSRSQVLDVPPLERRRFLKKKHRRKEALKKRSHCREREGLINRYITPSG